ncbi:hypothetical protein J3455_12625 [Pseudoalteromonas sp. NFXS39]|uniref:hypothetical protein n=1 Tax=Pseudoalteromonas sp. NFXS39 TaxID=2818437 RepID=UPI0032DFBFDE
MLQINSGKLFKNEVEYRNNLRGMIYTNLRFPRDVIVETAAGKLLPAITADSTNALVYELEELIEKRGEQRGILVSHSITPYALDFSVIISFALNCTASPSNFLVERLLSERPNLSTRTAPKSIVKRTFDSNIYCTNEDISHFTCLVSKLIGMKRKSYLSIMKSLRSYVTGMQRISDDLELAYTLIVASIESLAQEFDGHVAAWEDYDQSKRSKIDKALKDACPEVSKNVQNAILEINHTSLGRRFKDFSLSYTKPSFYRLLEAEQALAPITSFDLSASLSNAYQARSQYIHNLRKLPSEVTSSTPFAETCMVNNKPWMTIQGLSRLARHVITEFIMSQSTIEHEDYDYDLERAGVVLLPLASQYWIGNPVNYENNGTKKLGAFLTQYVSYLRQSPDAIVTDLKELLLVVEKKISEMHKDDKRAYATLYILYNCFVGTNDRMANAERNCSGFDKYIPEDSIESLIISCLLDHKPDIGLDVYYKTLMEYFKTRNNKLTLRVPSIIEAILVLELAELYRQSEQMQQAKKMISIAVECMPGNSQLLNLEHNFISIDNYVINWKNILFPANE